MQPENQTWHPGRVQDHEGRNKLFKLNVPKHIYSLISKRMVLAIDVSEENDMEEESRTELDSHANMPASGRQERLHHIGHRENSRRESFHARLRFYMDINR